MNGQQPRERAAGDGGRMDGAGGWMGGWMDEPDGYVNGVDGLMDGWMD